MRIMEYDKFDWRDIVITLPKSVKWSDYEKELEAAARGEVMNFRVSNFPHTGKGRRCYVVHDGRVRGWMEITGMTDKQFTCSTTGRKWHGKFVERSGKFHPVDGPAMRGFQGFRYI